jgi:hypothetical protein
MIILIITFLILVFLIYWTSKKATKYHHIQKHYKDLMNDDWKIEYMRNIENKEIDSELKPKHRVCLTCMNRK